MRKSCVHVGMEALHIKVHKPKRSFLHIFCNVFISKALLSYFVLFGDNSHYCFIKHLLCLLLSLKCFTASFSVKLMIIYLSTFQLEMRGSDW